jgi:hypothetical protein
MWVRSRTVGLVVGVLVASGLAALVGDDGLPAAEVELGGGSVWLASSSTGQLVLLDGSSAEVAVRVGVAADGQELRAAQVGMDGYAVNQATGTVARVDGAAWEVGDAVELLEGAGQGLGVMGSPDALFAVDTDGNYLVEADPVTLAVRGRPTSPGPVSSAVVDAAGALWVLDTDSGDVARVSRGEPTQRWDGVASGDRSTPLVVGGRAAVADPDQGEVRLLGTDGPGRATDLRVAPDDESLQIGAAVVGTQVLAVSGATGALYLSDVETGHAGDVIDGISRRGADLGVPVEAYGRVFIPNYTTGRVIVADLAADQVVARPRVLDPGIRFELLTRDGYAFYNDRDSEHAGVISLDGTVRRVTKYNPESPDEGLFKPGQNRPGSNPGDGDGDRGDGDNTPDAGPPVVTPPPGGEPSADPGSNFEDGDTGDGDGGDGDTGDGDGDPGDGDGDPGDGDGDGTAELSLHVEGAGEVDVRGVDDPSPCGPDESCDYQVRVGAVVALSAAEPSESEDLLDWHGCDRLESDSFLSTCSVAVTSDQEIKAIFQTAAELATLQVQVEGDGVVTVAGEGNACRAGSPDEFCSLEAPPGEVVRLTATPDDDGGVRWKQAGCGTEPTCDVELLPGDNVVSVEFLPPTLVTRHKLTVGVTPADGGSVTGNAIACGPSSSDCSEDYPAGTPVTLTATEEDGWTFLEWDDACAEEESKICEITIVPGEQHAGAVFSELDTTSPVLVSPGNQAFERPAGTNGMNVAYAGPSVADNTDPNPEVTCSPAAGSFFETGRTSVSCTAEDAAGNRSAPIEFLVDVQAPQPRRWPSPVVVADQWGFCGDMREDYPTSITHDAGWRWDGNIDDVSINVMTDRPQDTVSRWIVGTPVETGESLALVVHIGTGCWFGGPGISFQVDARFVG